MMGRSRFWYTSIAAAAVAAMALTSCSSGGGGEDKENTTVRISGTKGYVPTLSAFYGDEAGIFEKHGVDAEVLDIEGGGASMEALAAGEVDLINYFPGGLAQAAASGVEAYIVAAGSLVPNGWWLTSLADSGFETPEDLDGKDVGISSAGATTDLYAQFVAREAGVNFNLVPVGGSGMIPALIAGNVDAILAFPPQGYQLEADEGINLIADLAEENILYPDVWIASPELVEERPEVLQNTLDAIFETVGILQDEKDIAVQAIQDVAGYSPEIAERTYEDTIMGLSPDGKFTLDEIEEAMKLAPIDEDAMPSVDSIATTKFIGKRKE